MFLQSGTKSIAFCITVFAWSNESCSRKLAAVCFDQTFFTGLPYDAIPITLPAALPWSSHPSA